MKTIQLTDNNIEQYKDQLFELYRNDKDFLQALSDNDPLTDELVKEGILLLPKFQESNMFLYVNDDNVIYEVVMTRYTESGCRTSIHSCVGESSEDFFKDIIQVYHPEIEVTNIDYVPINR